MGRGIVNLAFALIFAFGLGIAEARDECGHRLAEISPVARVMNWVSRFRAGPEVILRQLRWYSIATRRSVTPHPLDSEIIQLATRAEKNGDYDSRYLVDRLIARFILARNPDRKSSLDSELFYRDGPEPDPFKSSLYALATRLQDRPTQGLVAQIQGKVPSNRPWHRPHGDRVLIVEGIGTEPELNMSLADFLTHEAMTNQSGLKPIADGVLAALQGAESKLSDSSQVGSEPGSGRAAPPRRLPTPAQSH